MRKSNKLILLLIVWIVGTLYLLYPFDNDLSFPDQGIIPKKYISLVKDECLRDIKIVGSFRHEHLDTISLVNYKKKYLVLFYKFKTPTLVPLTNYLTEERKSSFIGIKTYKSFGFGSFELSYLRQEGNARNTLIFKHCCDTSGFSVFQDEKAYFSSKVSSTSFQLGEDGQDNFVLSSLFDSPLSVAILKNGNDVYFAAMTPVHTLVNKSDSMDTQLLLNILK